MESRREFLKGTAWMAGAAMAVGCTMNKVSLGLHPRRVEDDQAHRRRRR